MTSGKALFVATWCAFMLTGSVMSEAAVTYEIDPAHSTVIFKVKNREVSYVYGRFNTISGTIVTDTLRKPSKIEINAEVQAKSVDTNDKKRDRDLKSADFLKVSKNPTITFKTKDAKRLDENRFELTGDLTLLGVTKELTVIFEMTGKKKIELTYRLGGEVTFTIKRTDFGMDHMIPEIADEITIIVSLEGVLLIPPSG